MGTRTTMAKKRAAHKGLPTIPKLPMMRAPLAIPTPPGGGKTARKPANEDDPKAQLMMLTRKIADKVQVLALRRPRALISVARVVDKLLDEQLEALLDVKHPDRGHDH